MAANTPAPLVEDRNGETTCDVVDTCVAGEAKLIPPTHFWKTRRKALFFVKKNIFRYQDNSEGSSTFLEPSGQ